MSNPLSPVLIGVALELDGHGAVRVQRLGAGPANGAADAGFAYFDLAPMKYSNWAEYRVGVQKTLFEPNQSIKFKLNDDLSVHRRGSLAWATVTFGADIVNRQGASSHLNGRWTMVLEKRSHGWIVVHEHVSVPLGGS